MAQRAQLGDTVLVHYIGRLQDGTIFTSSQPESPLELLIGADAMLPNFERALIGMKPGESKVHHIPCEQAYGPHRPEMVAVVDRQKMPKNLEMIEVGQRLKLPTSSGQPLPVSVTQIDGSKITLDVNHPLAGEDLTFEIHLVALEPWPRN